MRGERRFNFACAGIFKSYRAALVDLRLAPKIQGCSLCLAAILVYSRVNGRKETGASPAWQQKDMVERNERREIISIYERRTRDVSDR